MNSCVKVNRNRQSVLISLDKQVADSQKSDRFFEEPKHSKVADRRIGSECDRKVNAIVNACKHPRLLLAPKPLFDPHKHSTLN